MLISHPDLINSCRVCRSPNQDGDYECLYQYLGTDGEEISELSEAGVLYEDLLKISLNTQYYYPQFLCNSCDLQIKLFKKLKDTAYKTEEYLQNLHENIVYQSRKYIQQQTLEDKQEISEEIIEYTKDEIEYMRTENNCEEEGCKEDRMHEYVETVDDEYEEKLDNYEYAQETPSESQSSTGYEYQKCIKTNSYIENEHCDNDNHDCEEQNPIFIKQKEEPMEQDCLSMQTANDTEEIETSIEFLENQFHLKANSGNSSFKSSENKSHQNVNLPIDSNDFITEIYELLDDDTESKIDSCSENNTILESDVLIEEKTLSNSSFSDAEYVHEDATSSQDNENDQTIQNSNPAKNICISFTKRNVYTKRKREYSCKPCKMVFKTLQEQKLHRTQSHVEKYVCNVCFKELKSLTGFNHHMKVHNDQPAYQCEICQKTFNQKGHYQYHMNGHNNVRNFKCNVCEKAFLSKTDLKVHMRFHSGQRPYICNICGKDYLMMEHLKTHLLAHTDQYFQCDICQHKFTTHKTLRLHVRTIHEENKKFKCSFCSKPFRRKHHLESHLKVHQRNFKCSENNYEAIDDPDIIASEIDYNSEVFDEKDIIIDPGFIALNDNAV